MKQAGCKTETDMYKRTPARTQGKREYTHTVHRLDYVRMYIGNMIKKAEQDVCFGENMDTAVVHLQVCKCMYRNRGFCAVTALCLTL